MKISASIYSAGQKPLADLVVELDQHGVDFFHVDCNDQAQVFDDIAYCNAHSTTPVDLHIIAAQPQKYFEVIRIAKIKQVSFQYENFEGAIPFPSDLNCEIGLAITSNTSIAVFEAYKNTCSYILLMTTTPGKSGGVFDKDTFRKIRQFQKAYPNKKIQVDGGVNAEVSFILRNLGVEQAVVGSYLFSKNYVGVALLQLKKELVGSHYLLKDFMLLQDELPVLKESELTFPLALQTIEDYKMAFVLVVNEQQQLTGLISNADVRKGILKNIHQLNHIPIADCINRHPVQIAETKTIYDLLLFIKQLTFPLQYIPITTENGQLSGALLFTNFIKGEL